MPITRSESRISTASAEYPEAATNAASVSWVSRPSISNAAAWWLAIRPRTLGASLIPVLVGLAAASRGGPIDASIAALTLIAALLLQIATNLANDYYDFVRGVDTGERLGPLRVTQAGLLPPADVKRGLVVVLAAATVCGGFLIHVGGWPIAAIGITALATAVAYSAGLRPLAPLSWYGLGDVLAFSFFGVIAVCGTYYLQRGAVGVDAVVVSLPVACLVTGLIVVNNLRDIPTDTAGGKRTLAVRLGERGTRIVYATLLATAFACLTVAAVLITPALLISLIALSLAVREALLLWKREGAELNASLLGTARLHAIAGLLLAGGLIV